jgi:ferrous iron transport protein B
LINIAFQKLFLLTWHNVNNTLLRDFLVYGFLTGLSGFLVYVPNILLLFLISHLLFQTGLTARAARIVDPLFRVFGLNGYSFPPLLFGFGCSVNALHSAHNIENRKNRLLTMLIAPFMSCGSKFHVYLLLISVIFNPKVAGTVLFCLYVGGICFSLFSVLIFQKLLKIKRSETIEELPGSTFKKPDMLAIIKKTLWDGWIFLKKAGTIIVLASMVIWFFSYIKAGDIKPYISQAEYNEILKNARENDESVPPRVTINLYKSYIAKLGQFIEPVFKPIGQDWKSSVSLLSSFAGRGIIISSLVTLYGIEYSPEHHKTLTVALKTDESFSTLSALSLMIFVLLCGSCLASIAMFYHETNSVRLTGLFIIYPIIAAWMVCFVFFQVSKVIIGVL